MLFNVYIYIQFFSTLYIVRVYTAMLKIYAFSTLIKMPDNFVQIMAIYSHTNNVSEFLIP